jgi:hypothetical protein
MIKIFLLLHQTDSGADVAGLVVVGDVSQALLPFLKIRLEDVTKCLSTQANGQLTNAVSASGHTMCR